MRWRRREDDGAVAPFVAIIIVCVMLVAAFVVDIGMQRVGRADMQALADVVALDLARELDGDTIAQLSAAGLAPGLNPTLAIQSRNRNQDVIGDATPDLDVDLGEIVNGSFVDRSANAGFVPTAVRVEARTDVDFIFGGITGIATGDVDRAAVAQANGGACFAIGSYAARLDTGASPLLGPLLGVLGSNISLSAVDYNGLANAEVALIDLLRAEIGAGTLEELLTSSVGLGSFYLALADVLDGENTAQATLLQSIAATVGPAQLALADILGVTTGTGTGLDASLNVLDLVTAAAAAATGENAVIAQPSVNLGPVANVGLNLSVIEAPRIGCGRKNDAAATARSTQVSLGLSANALDIDLGSILLFGVLRSRVSLAGTVSVASARGQLTDVRCNPSGATVRVSDGLLEVNLDLEVTLRLAGIPVVSGPIHITGQTTTSGDAVINITSDADYDNPVTVGNSNSGLPHLFVNTSDLDVLGLPLGLGLNAVLSPLLNIVVNPLLQALDTVLLAPLLNTLGLDVSGADVYLRRQPVCALPRLVG